MARVGRLDADTARPKGELTRILESLRESVRKSLDDLTDKERAVLEMRFGLVDGVYHSLEEISEKFGLTRERIRQIEGKALRRLRHPCRSRELRDYLR